MSHPTTRPIGIDLFAGAGGFSLGFEQAGFDVVAAVEVDPIHAAVHYYNFPDCAILPRSVSDISGDEIRKISGIGDRSIDVVFGGAPCQGFSLIGQRILDDPRNALVRDFVRLVTELETDYFVFENVKGLTVGKHRKFLDELIETFESNGYQVAQPWRVLNAANFGVPQNRERLILLGARQGLPIPEYPQPITRPAGSKRGKQEELPDSPNCRNALDDLPNIDKFKSLIKKDSVATGKWGKPSQYAELMRCLSDDAWGYGYQRNFNSRLLTSSLRSNHTDTSRRRFDETEPGKTEPISRFFKLPPDGVSNTLRAGTDSARGAFTSPRPIHYAYPRCITVREMARLHSFPDWFRFHETKWHGARQIGNAVPPLLARAIASSLLDTMGITPRRPEGVIDLGSQKLLKMNMAEASKYWKIEVPIRSRDRADRLHKRRRE
ncbi:MAG: DNA cytosine methyltransferase [Limnospira sp.]